MANTRVREDTKEKRQRVHEIVGRSVSGTQLSERNQASYSYDTTITDYGWWDKFRRCVLKGFEFAGLFAKPITQIIAGWVLGSDLSATLVDAEAGESTDYTNDLLQRFMKSIHGLLGQLVEDLYALGDQFVVVNNDGSLSIPSPEMVNVDYALLDYRHPVRYTITSKFENATVRDIYTVAERVLQVETTNKEVIAFLLANGYQQIDTKTFALTFENLIGRLPVIHFANDRGSNETRGRPIYEALFRLFSRYNDLLTKMIGGALLMGNPIPVFEGLEDIEETIEANADSGQDYTDNLGNTQTRRRIRFDKLSVILLGKGGAFKFAAPAVGFTKDIRDTLKSLFLLIMEFTRIPDGMWGAELGSARATLVEQMRTFEMYVVSRRNMLAGQGADQLLGTEPQGGLLELIHVWLLTRSLIDPKIVVGQVSILWTALNQEDQTLLLEKIKHADDQGYLSSETSLALLELVEDAEAEIAAAKVESEANKDPYDQAVDDLMNSNSNDDEDTPEAAA